MLWPICYCNIQPIDKSVIFSLCVLVPFTIIKNKLCFTLNINFNSYFNFKNNTVTTEYLATCIIYYLIPAGGLTCLTHCWCSPIHCINEWLKVGSLSPAHGPPLYRLYCLTREQAQWPRFRNTSLWSEPVENVRSPRIFHCKII